MKKLLVVMLVVILLGAAAFYIYRFQEKPVEKGLFLSGNIEVTEPNLGFKLAGKVVELLVEEGQKVARGEKLAALESSELEGVVAQNRAYLSEALVKLEELKTGSRPQEIERAKADVKSAEAEFTRLKKEFERAEMLFRNGAVSASNYDAAKSAHETSAAQQRSAREKLSLVTEGPRKEEIRAAEFRVQQAKAALDVSQERLKDTVIHAPVSGVVLRKNVELGETVSQGVPVYTLGDLDNPWVKVYVKEDKLGLVKLGQKAKVTVDTYPGKVYEGKVIFISSEAEFTPKNVQTQEERVKLVFGVKVSVTNMNDELKPGMPADVRILVNE